MPSNITLSRATRGQVKAAIRANPQWSTVMPALGFELKDATKAQLLALCEQLGIDIANLGAAVEPIESEDERDEMTVTPETAPEAPASPAGFEGRDADEVITEALAPITAHLTPHALSLLPGVLTPLAKAAVQGPRTVTQTVIRSAPSQGASVPPAVNVLTYETARVVFGFGKRFAGNAEWGFALDHAQLAVCDYAAAPKVDPDYVWDPAILAQLAAADSAGKCVWAYGPAGVGKTEGIQQYAARLHRPFVRIAIHRRIEEPEIIGQRVLAKDGGMEWRDGLLSAAFRIPYCVILIDEPSLLPPGVSAIFQTALDQRRLFLNGGAEVLDAAQGIFIVAADNTAGSGDDSGRYVGVENMSAALLDRFAIKLPFVHMPVDKEAIMLASRSGLAKDACAVMVGFASLTRANADAGTLTMGVTPRRLIAWSTMVRAGIPSAKAFESTIVNGCAPEDKETLLQLQTTSVNHPKIDALARGNAAPAESTAPEVSAAISAVGATFPESN